MNKEETCIKADGEYGKHFQHGICISLLVLSSDDIGIVGTFKEKLWIGGI